MRDKHYKVRHIRLSEETYQRLKDKRKRSGLSWNLFMVELLKRK